MTYNNRITILPKGCLDETEITLACKSPGETLPYSFSVANRIASTDYITKVSPQPALESQVTIYKIEIDGPTFKCKIKGGKKNHNVGIRFVILTHEENIIEFDCKLPIRQSGVLEINGVFSSVLDATSPVGTITVNSTNTLAPGSDATVEDVGNAGAAFFNFGIPRGDKGETGPQGETGVNGKDGKDGISPTLSIGKVTSLPPGEQPTAEIVHGADGNDTLDLSLVKGEKGDDGESYPNDGTVNLNVKSVNSSASLNTETNPLATVETTVNKTYATAKSVIPSMPIEQIMHRGGVTSVIENNLYNDKMSYQANPYISLEGDIQPCATDGKYFRWHNNSTDTDLDKSITVMTSTYDQLKALRFKGLANTAFADTTLNTLDEWCEWIKQVGRPFYPEVKRYRTMDDVVGMVNVVKSYGISHLCTWQSGEYAVLQKVRETDPECGVGYLNFGEDSNIDSSIAKMVSLGNGSLLWSQDLINQDTSVIEKCIANNVGLATWTVTTNLQYKNLIDLGVRRIMTNYLMNEGV